MNLREWARATHRALNRLPAAERQDYLTHAQVEKVLRMAIAALIDSLSRGGELRIDALGRMWVEEKPPRRVVSNLAGEPREHKLPERKAVRFRASSRLAKQLDTGLSLPQPHSPDEDTTPGMSQR